MEATRQASSTPPSVAPAADAGQAALSSPQFCALVDQTADIVVAHVRATDARADLTPEDARGAIAQLTPRSVIATVVLRAVVAGYQPEAVRTFVHDFPSDAESCMAKMTPRLAALEPALTHLAAVAQKPDPPRLSPAWRTDLDTALTEARAAGRPVLLRFHAAWLGADAELDKRVFGDPGVVAELKRFVAIRVDATDDDAPGLAAAKAKYAVVGLPTILLFDGQGHEVRRIEAFINAAELRGFLSEVTARASDRRSP